MAGGVCFEDLSLSGHVTAGERVLLIVKLHWQIGAGNFGSFDSMLLEILASIGGLYSLIAMYITQMSIHPENKSNSTILGFACVFICVSIS